MPSYHIFRGHIPALESTNQDVYFPNNGWLRVSPEDPTIDGEDGKTRSIDILVTNGQVEELFEDIAGVYRHRYYADKIHFQGFVALDQAVYYADGEFSRSGHHGGMINLNPADSAF